VPDEAGRIRRAIGALIILIGVLWILLAGGCTLVYAGASIFGITSGAANNASPDARYAAAYDTMILPISLALGFVGIASGVLVFLGGRRLYRRGASSAEVLRRGRG